MDECVDCLGGARVYSTLDASSRYWQIEVHKAIREKTAFISHNGLFKFTSMPFSLKNAPVTFQSVMGIILSSIELPLALVYLDDIFISSKTTQ